MQLASFAVDVVCQGEPGGPKSVVRNISNPNRCGFPTVPWQISHMRLLYNVFHVRVGHTDELANPILHLKSQTL